MDSKRTKGGEGQGMPEIGWVEAADNPWGVRVLDVRPVTLTMISTSSDPACASNAMSFGQEDGSSFIGQQPPVRRRIEADLRFPIDRMLAEGVLFTPREMEHKWAIFYRQGAIICVRSWLRQVRALARVEVHRDAIVISEIQGTLGADDEPPELTRRMLDFLLRSHALEMVYPAPLPAGMEQDPAAAALWCMSMFGNQALAATPHALAQSASDRPLRTVALLHIAVARGDRAAIEACLAAGTPVDLLASDGLAPLHWALACADPAIMDLLLKRGSPVDVRSEEGATPLMNAAQDGSLDQAAFLLERGAAANAQDLRGFTALHRAAELGHGELVRLLLAHGADPDLAGQGGHTPRSVAEARQNQGVIAIMEGWR